MSFLSLLPVCWLHLSYLMTCAQLRCFSGALPTLTRTDLGKVPDSAHLQSSYINRMTDLAMQVTAVRLTNNLTFSV